MLWRLLVAMVMYIKLILLNCDLKMRRYITNTKYLLYIILDICMVGIFIGASNCYCQSRFNRIIDCEHQTMNVLVSVLPMHDGYILTIGSGDVEGYGSNRCTMLVKTDTEGNVLYKNFICDNTLNVFEGRFSSGLVTPTSRMTYKCILEGSWSKIIYCEFDDSLNYIYRRDTNFDIPHTIGDAYYFSYDIYIVGQIYDNNKYCGYIEKRDSMGSVLNRIIPLGYNVESGYDAIIRNNENDLLVHGIIATNIHNHLYSLVKLDTSLNIIWQKTYGRANWNNGEKAFIAPSPDNCYVMSGIYPVCYADRFEYRTNDAACIRKIDDNGNLLWEKVIKNYYSDYYNGPGVHSVDCTYDIYVDEYGYMYVAGQGTIYTGFTGFLTKLSPDGNIMYRRYYTPDGSKSGPRLYLNSVKPTPDGGLIMGGYTYDSYYTAAEFGDYFQQPWLVKTDTDGLDGLCYTELPELTLDVFIPDTVCNLDTLDCVVNISGPSAPYRLDFSTGQTIENIYYPDVFVPKEIGIDTVLSGELLYQYTETVTEATIKDSAAENTIARHYNIRTPRDPGEQQLAITLSDYYGNIKTIYKDIYVNPCHDLAVDENDNIMLSVYPNPATEYINIAGENIAGIEICNLLGEVVYETQLCNGNNVIFTDGMGAGSYFVKVRMADGKVVTKKIVVIK